MHIKIPLPALCSSILSVIFLAQYSAAASPAAPGSSPADPPVTVIRAGHLIDVLAGRVLAHQLIVIRGTKIQEVGADLAIPEGAKVIDLSNETVLPGLVDCHTHLADLADSEPLDVLKRTAVDTAYAAIPNARVTLLAGFTTVRDVGVYRAFNDVAMRDAIANGIFIGPRMYVAGAYITISEGAGAMTGLSPDIQLPWDLHYGEANSPWEVRQKIRELAHRGADHIKILSTGAVLTHGSNPKSIEFTPEELRAAVEEAANFGLRVAAHAHAAEGIKNAIRAGVASVEHATLIDDEGIALAKQHGTYLDMDIYDEECIQSAPDTPADFLQHDRDLAEAQRRNFTKAVRAGVKMTFGTDAGVCPHGINARQFAFMVKYGMTPMQAIQSATVNAADLIGHSELFGSITAGKSADIVAVNGDPLADIRELEHVHFVMKEGKVYKFEE
ncbi:MAG: amidohydrolase family protein [Steroidobacteraceae bacterium]